MSENVPLTTQTIFYYTVFKLNILERRTSSVGIHLACSFSAPYFLLPIKTSRSVLQGLSIESTSGVPVLHCIFGSIVGDIVTGTSGSKKLQIRKPKGGYKSMAHRIIF